MLGRADLKLVVALRARVAGAHVAPGGHWISHVLGSFRSLWEWLRLARRRNSGAGRAGGAPDVFTVDALTIRHPGVSFETHIQRQRGAHTRFARNRICGTGWGDTGQCVTGEACCPVPAKPLIADEEGRCCGARSVAVRATGRTPFPRWATHGGRRLSRLTAGSSSTAPSALRRSSASAPTGHLRGTRSEVQGVHPQPLAAVKHWRWELEATPKARCWRGRPGSRPRTFRYVQPNPYGVRERPSRSGRSTGLRRAGRRSAPP